MEIHDFDAPWQSPDWVRWTMRMIRSYEHLLGESLIAIGDGTIDGRSIDDVSLHDGSSESELARALFEAPFAVLAHNTASDPLFVYGNRTALDLWEVDLPTLLTMPSRQSAESDVQPERGAMLQRGLERGFIEDYGGVRISASGRRFRIEGATIWNVFDAAACNDEFADERRVGQAGRVGQAATFSNWHDCDAPNR